MGKRDWRKTAEPIPDGPMELYTWYRSPLWDKDHLLGEDPVWKADGLAWCGRSLDAARGWDNERYGGLWITNRKSAPCPICRKMQEQWTNRGKW